MAKKAIDPLNYLLSLGIKEGLLNKLNDSQKSSLAEFALDNANMVNLVQNLIILASMEISGKSGAIFLAAQKFATITQLKNLESQDITNVIEDYKVHGDEVLVIQSIKKFIIKKQQKKLMLHGHPEIDLEDENISRI